MVALLPAVEAGDSKEVDFVAPLEDVHASKKGDQFALVGSRERTFMLGTSRLCRLGVLVTLFSYESYDP